MGHFYFVEFVRLFGVGVLRRGLRQKPAGRRSSSAHHHAICAPLKSLYDAADSSIGVMTRQVPFERGTGKAGIIKPCIRRNAISFCCDRSPILLTPQTAAEAFPCTATVTEKHACTSGASGGGDTCRQIQRTGFKRSKKVGLIWLKALIAPGICAND